MFSIKNLSRIIGLMTLVLLLVPFADVQAACSRGVISANPQSISEGIDSRLTWLINDAYIGMVTGVNVTGFGSVGPAGAPTVNPAVTTTYTMTASFNDGVVESCSATVYVGEEAPDFGSIELLDQLFTPDSENQWFKPWDSPYTEADLKSDDNGRLVNVTVQNKVVGAGEGSIYPIFVLRDSQGTLVDLVYGDMEKATQKYVFLMM